MHDPKLFEDFRVYKYIEYAIKVLENVYCKVCVTINENKTKSILSYNCFHLHLIVKSYIAWYKKCWPVVEN